MTHFATARPCQCFVGPSDRNDFKEAGAARSAEEARAAEEAANAAGAQAEEEELTAMEAEVRTLSEELNFLLTGNLTEAGSLAKRARLT
jgi:hypothetical protein